MLETDWSLITIKLEMLSESIEEDCRDITAMATYRYWYTAMVARKDMVLCASALHTVRHASPPTPSCWSVAACVCRKTEVSSRRRTREIA